MRFIGLVLLMLLLSSQAGADTYVSAAGGMNFSTNFSADGEASFEALPDTGYVALGALGTTVDAVPGLRAEIEASWRHAALGGTLDACGPPGPLDGSDGTFAAMFNVAYDLPVMGGKVYGLAGAGYGFRRIVIEPTPDNWENTSSGTERAGFVWQLGVGADYPVTETVSVGLGYRYFVGPGIDRVAIFNGKDSFFQASGENHAVLLTIAAKL